MLSLERTVPIVVSLPTLDPDDPCPCLSAEHEHVTFSPANNPRAVLMSVPVFYN